MRAHTIQDLEKDLALLWAYESEGITQADLGAREGLSQSQLSRRLARGRRYRAELAKTEREDRQVQPSDDLLPFVALTDDPERERGDWYDLDTDDTTVEDGLMRMTSHSGQHLMVINRWAGAIDATVKGPTTHKPDPKGLKGGIG